MAKPVRQEVERIKELLKKDDLLPKQRLCLSIALYTLQWNDSLSKAEKLPLPSEKIMQAK